MKKFFGILALLPVAALCGVASYHGPRKGSSDVLIEITSPDGEFVCSGVYLGNGIVLTARHCVMNDATKIEITTDDGGRLGSTVEAVWEWTSETADVATYRVKGGLDAPAAELACRVPVIGEPVEVVGNPLDIYFVHKFGRVAGAAVATNDGANADEVPIDAAIASGNSGGPVYDTAGRVLGIANEGRIPDAEHGESGSPVAFMVSSQEACEKYGAPGLLADLWLGLEWAHENM